MITTGCQLKKAKESGSAKTREKAVFYRVFNRQKRCFYACTASAASRSAEWVFD
jgi:hypothetical protein